MSGLKLLESDLLRVTDRNGPCKPGYHGLIESIRKHGFFPTYPIIVVAQENGLFNIVQGRHRFYASQHIGLEKVLCIIVPDEIGKLIALEG